MTRSFPWVALGLGLVLSLILLRFSPLAGPDGGLPLLTSLLMAELGLVVTAVAAAVGVRELLKQGVRLRAASLVVGNLLLAANFLRMGLAMWPDAAGAS
jgi:hypothetical protein